MKPLRIAQLVLPWISLPPAKYAGTERIVYNLTEGLVKKGHDVTLFSVGESKTSAKLEYIFEKSLTLQTDVLKTLKSSFNPLMHVAHCFEMQDSFDIIHSHAQFLGLPFAAVSKTPCIHTFHQELTFQNQDEKDLVHRYRKLPFTSISDAQRVPNLNFISTVYNGVDTDLYTSLSTPPQRTFLFWAGRVVEKKGPKLAIHVSKKLGYPLIMAGKITDREYFETQIKPEIDGKLIRFEGELSDSQMVTYLQNARATLFPVTWNEPFGLIPVESMACGTPVVSFAIGGVKETVPDGVGGFLADPIIGFADLLVKTKTLLEMDDESYRKMCNLARLHVEDNFGLTKMVDGYESVYYKQLGISE